MMNKEDVFDPREYANLLRETESLSKTHETHMAKGEFAWSEEAIKEAKGVDLEELICGSYYLNMANVVRPAVIDDIFKLWEERRKRKIHLVCFEEGIGSGKTEKAAIILWLQWFEVTLRGVHPQDYFGIPSTSTITFLCSSSTEAQAKRVAFKRVFGKFMSDFNKDYFPPDTRKVTEIQIKRNNTCVYPGNSSALSIQGYDYIGGMMDEVNSMERTEDSKKARGKSTTLFDAAEELEAAIRHRMTSRFFGKAGMIVAISSNKYEEDFLRRKGEEYLRFGDDSYIYFVRRTLAESFYVAAKIVDVNSSEYKILSKYDENATRKIRDEDGFFYIDIDTGTEIKENVAKSYYVLLDAVKRFKKGVLEHYNITMDEYKGLVKLKKEGIEQ